MWIRITTGLVSHWVTGHRWNIVNNYLTLTFEVCCTSKLNSPFYISEAIRFMEGNSKPSMIANSQMVFAEQRLLAMCAKEMSVEIVSLVGDPFDSTNDLSTHLWGAKRLVRRDEYQRQRLEEALLRKVKAFSEEYYNLLCEIR